VIPIWNIGLRLISKRALKAFWEAHPQAVSPLMAWKDAIQHVSLKTGGIARVFGSVDLWEN